MASQRPRYHHESILKFLFSILWGVVLCSCSHDLGRMTRVLLVSGTARFDRNGNVVLNSISKKLRPVFVIEGSC